MNGLFFEVNGDFLSIVATDGHRLARSSLHIESENISFILPYKSAKDIEKHLKTGQCEMRINSNNVSFVIGTSEITSKLIDGKFPDYRRVIPASNENKVIASRDQLKNSVSRAVVLA